MFRGMGGAWLQMAREFFLFNKINYLKRVLQRNRRFTLQAPGKSGLFLFHLLFSN
jgi:hypothetical protein